MSTLAPEIEPKQPIIDWNGGDPTEKFDFDFTNAFRVNQALRQRHILSQPAPHRDPTAVYDFAHQRLSEQYDNNFERVLGEAIEDLLQARQELLDREGYVAPWQPDLARMRDEVRRAEGDRLLRNYASPVGRVFDETVHVDYVPFLLDTAVDTPAVDPITTEPIETWSVVAASQPEPVPELPVPDTDAVILSFAEGRQRRERRLAERVSSRARRVGRAAVAASVAGLLLVGGALFERGQNHHETVAQAVYGRQRTELPVADPDPALPDTPPTSIEVTPVRPVDQPQPPVTQPDIVRIAAVRPIETTSTTTLPRRKPTTTSAPVFAAPTSTTTRQPSPTTTPRSSTTHPVTSSTQPPTTLEATTTTLSSEQTPDDEASSL